MRRGGSQEGKKHEDGGYEPSRTVIKRSVDHGIKLLERIESHHASNESS
jgi:hypothetical protein